LIQLTNKYDYNELDRNTDRKTGVRYYSAPGGKVASVTTILDKTKAEEDKEGLQKWRDFVGEKEAKRVVTEAGNVGTLMHLKLEQYCLGESKKPGGNLIHQQAHKMSQVIIEHGLSNVNELWGVECPLFYEGLYAGTTDLVGEHKGQPAIMDFKQTNKPKTDERVKDYKCQLVAYGLAHNMMFGTEIKTGVIMMCTRDLQYQEWVLEKDEWEEYTDKWLHRLHQFYLHAA